MTGIYYLAERIIHITSKYAYIHEMCRDYQAESMADSLPDITVSTTSEDIAFERTKSEQEDLKNGQTPHDWNDDYLETLAVYRKIAEKMPAFDTVLFHGSALSVDGTAYIFTAKSGTGKSTHTRLWREMLGERAVMVNDDKPLIRVSDNESIVYGTPWDGKHHLSNNIAVPIKALCLLQRSATNQIKPISAADALPVLLQQTYRPSDTEAMMKTISLINRFMKQVKLYRMGCNMEPAAAATAYEALTRDKMT